MTAGEQILLRGTVIASGTEELGQIGVAGGVFDSGATGGQVLEGYVLPGLVDVHCHLGLGPAGAVDRGETLRQADAETAAGVLLVRDAGSPTDTRWLHERGDVPDLIRAGRHIARPKRYIRGYAVELDDPDGLSQEMAVQARDGEGWVKVVGDWIDRPVGDLSPLWTAEQLRDGVAAAHAEGARVMVHTFAAEAADDLLAAGVDCIEHGTGLSAAHIEEAAARGVAITPTLLQIGSFDEFAAQGEARFPAYAARMRAMHRRRHEQVAAFHEAGVRLLVGTDAGGVGAHGRIAEEAAQMVVAGVPAPAVVAAASYAAREYLGRPGIAEGAPADAVVYPADPRIDIGVLAHPSAVVRGGVRVA